jgi:ParB family chromosome partitioning protein
MMSANMAGESRTLGKGLDALLGSKPAASSTRASGALPISSIQAGAYQPRHTIPPETLKELAASIKANGVIQAILVRRLPGEIAGGTRYEIIAGERRWQAAKLAGLTEIPAVVRELSDKEALAIALIENIQREDLTATDEARALKRLVAEFSLTQQAIADSIGRSRAAVSNLIRLLELPPDIIHMIDSQVLGMGHARALLALDDPEEQKKAAQQVVTRELSVRETEQLVRNIQQGHAAKPSRKPVAAAVSPVLKTTAVCAHLHQRPNGSGKIIIDFADAGSRDELLDLIRQFEGE